MRPENKKKIKKDKKKKKKKRERKTRVGRWAIRKSETRQKGKAENRAGGDRDEGVKQTTMKIKQAIDAPPVFQTKN